MAGTLASHFIAGAVTVVAGEALKQFVMGGLHVGGGRDALFQGVTSIGYMLQQADHPSPVEHMLGINSRQY